MHPPLKPSKFITSAPPSPWDGGIILFKYIPYAPKVQDTSAVNQLGIIHRYQLPNTPAFQFPNSHMPPGFHTPILPSFQAINMHGMHVPNMQG